MTNWATRKIAPIVSDADRQWALDQKPAWWDRKAAERAARLNLEPLDWADHVDDQADRFETEQDNATDRKPAAEWSGLWRRVWWPKADPRKRWPLSAPYEHDGERHPVFKTGSPQFMRALELATPAERAMWQRFGVAQFSPADPRLAEIAA